MTTTLSDPTASPVCTPEDLLKLPDAVKYELVDGRLVERHMGAESSEIALRIALLLGLFLRDHRLGRLFGSDTSYQCFAGDPNRVRRADVGFVRTDRLPDGRAPKGHVRVAPDLAAEVVSPNDTAEDVEAKVDDWLAAGVPLVWVVYPGTRTVRVHRPRTADGGSVADLTGTDVVTGGEVLPGFACRVSEFFDDVA